MEASYVDLTIRLSLALVLGGAIGIEREYRAKEAGFRTHFLVALGSALFCVVSQFGFGFDLKDSSRVAVKVKVCGTGMYLAATIATVMVLFGLEVINALIPQLGSTVVDLSFSAPSIESIRQLIAKMRHDGMDVKSYEIKERRTSQASSHHTPPHRV